MLKQGFVYVFDQPSIFQEFDHFYSFQDSRAFFQISKIVGHVLDIHHIIKIGMNQIKGQLPIPRNSSWFKPPTWLPISGVPLVCLSARPLGTSSPKAWQVPMIWWTPGLALEGQIFGIRIPPFKMMG